MVGVFYKFSKRPNSTLLPGNSDSPIVYADLIINDNNSSLANLEIRMLPQRVSGMPEGGSIFEYNYCAIVAFHRYYFVTNWRVDKQGYFTAIMEVDVLGSFRDNILAGEGFVIRCSNSFYRDIRLSDTFYPARNSIYQMQGLYTDTPHSYFTIDPANATYIIEYTPSAVVGGAFQAPQTYGTSCFMAIRPNNLRVLLANLSTVIGNYEPSESSQMTWNWFNGNTFDIEDIINTVSKNFCNPMQYIKGIKMFPLTFSKVLSNDMVFNIDSPIILGGWNSQAVGYVVSPNMNYYETFHITIPRPQYNADETYGIYPPYVSYSIYNPLIGTILLDAILMSDVNINSLRIEFYVNFISGQGRMKFYTERFTQSTGEYDLITHMQTLEFNCCMDIAVAQKSVNGFEMVKSIASFAAGGLPNTTENTGMSNYNSNSVQDWKRNSSYGSNSFNSSVTTLNMMNGAEKTLGVVNILKSALPEYHQLSTTSGGFFADVNKFILYANYQARSKPEPEVFGYLCQAYYKFRDMNVYSDTPGENYTQRTYLQAENVIIPQKHGNYTMTTSEQQAIVSNIKSGIYIETEDDVYG